MVRSLRAARRSRSTVASDAQQTNFLAELPVELFERVVRALSLPTSASLASCCRSFRPAVSEYVRRLGDSIRPMFQSTCAAQTASRWVSRRSNDRVTSGYGPLTSIRLSDPLANVWTLTVWHCARGEATTRDVDIARPSVTSHSRVHTTSPASFHARLYAARGRQLLAMPNGEGAQGGAAVVVLVRCLHEEWSTRVPVDLRRELWRGFGGTITLDVAVVDAARLSSTIDTDLTWTHVALRMPSASVATWLRRWREEEENASLEGQMLFRLIGEHEYDRLRTENSER